MLKRSIKRNAVHKFKNTFNQRLLNLIYKEKQDVKTFLNMEK